MLRLPSRFALGILSFAPLFFQRSWQHAEVLLLGAILAPGERTVTSLLRISGLARERRHDGAAPGQAYQRKGIYRDPVRSSPGPDCHS